MNRMELGTLFAALFCLTAADTYAQIAIADFSNHGAGYGAYNLTNDGARLEVWTTQIENAGFVVSATVHVDVNDNYGANDQPDGYLDAEINYLITVVDKQSGLSALTATVDPGFYLNLGIPVGYSVFTNQFSGFRPALAWVEPVAGNGNFAIEQSFMLGYTGFEAAGSVFQVYGVPFEYTPGTGWAQSGQRMPVNFSESQGNAMEPSIVALSGGDFIVSWVDNAQTGAIGGTAGINSSNRGGFDRNRNGNPSDILYDVYCRRFRQLEQPLTGPGAEAVPGLNTINISRSDAVHEDFAWLVGKPLDGVTDKAWVVFMSESDGLEHSVAGGTSNGPVESQEAQYNSRDAYLVELDVSTGLSVVADSVLNVTQSSGRTRPFSSAAYNANLNDVAVLFQDDTCEDGICGFAGAAALKTANGDHEFDYFLATVNVSSRPFTVNGVVNLNPSQGYDPFAAVAPLGSRGWAVAYSNMIDTGETFGCVQAYDAALAPLLALPQAAPRRAGGFQDQWIFALTSFDNGLSVAYWDSVAPDELRAGQSGPLGEADIFLAYGEITLPAVADGLTIRGANVNGGAPLTLRDNPTSVAVSVTLANTSRTYAVQASAISLALPQGYSFDGVASPMLPLTIAPASSIDVTLAVTIAPRMAMAGVLSFSLTVSGAMNGAPVTTSPTEVSLTLTGELPDPFAAMATGGACTLGGARNLSIEMLLASLAALALVCAAARRRI